MSTCTRWIASGRSVTPSSGSSPATPDDLVICCWKQEQARRALEVLTRLLAELGLQLAPAKTRVVNLGVEGEGFDFLGYHFRRIPSRKTGRPYAACWPSRAAMTAARDRVRPR